MLVVSVLFILTVLDIFICTFYRVLISPYPDPGRKKATATKTYNTIPSYGVQTTGIYSQEYIPVVSCWSL